MQNDQRILELLAEVLQKVDVLSEVIQKVDALSVKVNGLIDDVSLLKEEVNDLKDNVVKLNIISSENSRALMKLADNTEGRLSRLEKAVFK